MNTTTVRLSTALIHDYDSRGLLHELVTQNDLRVISENSVTTLCQVTPHALHFLIGDIEYQLECHDPDRNWRSTLNRASSTLCTAFHNLNNQTTKEESKK